MKLFSWNVNGLRACMTKGFADFLAEAAPDVICLQETKMQREQANFEFPGYEEYWNSAERKGYSGTAIFTKVKPLSVKYGLGQAEHDTEGRVITLEFPNFYLVTVYTPNSKDGLLRLDYRMVWEDVFREYLQKLDTEKPVVVCGDLNVAAEEIDLKNPKTNRKNAGFTDTFRYLHPEEVKYSWWSYRFRAREKNSGWRIDYFMVSDRLAEKVQSAEIHNDIFGSDHCPVSINLDIE